MDVTKKEWEQLRISVWYDDDETYCTDECVMCKRARGGEIGEEILHCMASNSGALCPIANELVESEVDIINDESRLAELVYDFDDKVLLAESLIGCLHNSNDLNNSLRKMVRAHHINGERV